MTDIPNKTVADKMRFVYRYSARKLELPNELLHASNELAYMDCDQFLDAISEAIEERLEDFKQSLSVPA